MQTLEAEETRIPHNLFVHGIKSGILKMEVKSKEGEFLNHFITPLVRFFLTALLLVTIAPIIIIPLICYLKSKWILLFGLGALWIATIVTNITLRASKPKKQLIELSIAWLFFTSVLIYYLGALNTLSFVAICFLYEYFFLCFSDLLHDEIVKRKLIKNEMFYKEALEKGYITINYI